MTDESSDRDPEIRRRAAWLLAMLALAAVLFVVLMVTFFNSSSSDPTTDDLAGPSTSPTPGATSSVPSGSSSGSSASRSSSGSATSSGSLSGSSSASAGATVSCPSDSPCALDTDVGNAVQAINAYRTSEGKQAIPGAVSDDAKQCALARGSGCKGGWAETELPTKHGKADGVAAVDKIKQFGKLLSDMKSIEVGWAYDPGSKTLYFATIRRT